MGKSRDIDGKTKDNADNIKHYHLSKFEFFTLMLAVIAIIISIISIYISIINSYNIADYQITQQVSVDKKAAAEQFYIEINSTYPSLHGLASKYFDNYDISTNGNSVIIDPNGETVLNINSISGKEEAPYLIDYIDGSIVSAKQLDEIPLRDNGSMALVTPPRLYIGDTKGEVYCIVDNPIIPGPLYRDNGVYYAYIKDISKFDANLSQDLYVYYNEITKAESDRQYIQSYLDSHPNGTIEGNYFDIYMNMRLNVMDAACLAPRILQELENEM